MQSTTFDEYVSHPIYVNYVWNYQIPIGIVNNTGYLKIDIGITQVNVKKYFTHRLIAEIFIGDIPKGFVVDHINKKQLDNRVHNLRIVTSSENNFNKNPQQS